MVALSGPSGDEQVGIPRTDFLLMQDKSLLVQSTNEVMEIPDVVRGRTSLLEGKIQKFILVKILKTQSVHCWI